MNAPPPGPPPTVTGTGGAPARLSLRPKDEAQGLERVYVWDAVVRGTHWTIVVTLMVLTITGIYIGRPYFIPLGAPDQQFVMGTMKIVHFYTAIAFTLAVLVRFGWMFTGSFYARWHQFIPTTKKRRADIVRMLKFYTFVTPEPPLFVGHNPLAGVTYVVVFVCYFLMILTGLGLYSVDAGDSYMRVWGFLLPVFGGPQTARWIHHIVMWLLIAFFAHHIWSAVQVSRYEGQGLMDSIFSGYKFLPRKWRRRD